MHPQWVRDLRRQCDAAGVAFLLKQNGEFASVSEAEGFGAHFTFRTARQFAGSARSAPRRALNWRARSGIGTWDAANLLQRERRGHRKNSNNV